MSKQEIVIEAVSNGLGAQSMLCWLMACKGIIPATVSLTADTGSEQECQWSTGITTSARIYFDLIVLPLSIKYGMDARMVRSVDINKDEIPALWQAQKALIALGKLNSLAMPLFGSKGGQRGQSCTDKWKIRAIRQEARRMGATKLITAQGIHAGEIGRRRKGIPLGMRGEWNLYQDTITRKIDGVKTEVPVRWCQHYYPLADRGYGRKTAQEILTKEGIPYLLTTECDMCPHQDLPRWERHSPEMLVQIAEVEAQMGGKFFFTDERVPLMEALQRKRMKPRPTLEADFGCGNSYCGI